MYFADKGDLMNWRGMILFPIYSSERNTALDTILWAAYRCQFKLKRK